MEIKKIFSSQEFFSFKLNWPGLLAFAAFWVYGLFGAVYVQTRAIQMLLAIILAAIFLYFFVLSQKPDAAATTISVTYQDVLVFVSLLIILGIFGFHNLQNSLQADQIYHSGHSQTHGIFFITKLAGFLPIIKNWVFRYLLWGFNFLFLAFGIFGFRLIKKTSPKIQAILFILAFIFLPGTIIHELAHLFTAAIMFVPVGRIAILPEVDGEEIHLGSVEIGQTDILRRTLIGVAPLLLGLAVIMGILWLSMDNLSTGPIWQKLLGLYLIFQIGNSMFSSRKDMEEVLLFLVGLMAVSLAILAGIYFLGLMPGLLNFLNNDFTAFQKFFLQADIFLLVPLGINIVLFLIAKTFSLKRS